MKAILCSLIMLISLLSYSQEKAPKPLRHFMQSGPSPVDQIPYGNNPNAGHYVNASDAKIYYEVYGKGQPILILHGGLFGSTIEMAGFINTLKKTNRVIAVSLRGMGNLTRPEKSLQINR